MLDKALRVAVGMILVILAALVLLPSATHKLQETASSPSSLLERVEAEVVNQCVASAHYISQRETTLPHQIRYIGKLGDGSPVYLALPTERDRKQYLDSFSRGKYGKTCGGVRFIVEPGGGYFP